MIIDKNIPIPLQASVGRKKSHIAHQMEIGDSVLCTNKKVANIVRSILNSRGFTTNVRIEGAGFRAWCVEKKTRQPKKA